jgi:cobyrinic acid a,c-diamide synthase
VLREALAAAGHRILGAIRRTDAVTTPSRHLGLIPAAERHAQAAAAIDGMAALIAGSCDLDALLAVAAQAPPLAVPAWDPAQVLTATSDPARAATGGPGPRARPATAPARPVVAVAGGPAFTFGYTEQAELLSAAGAEVAVFDPLRDEHLPARTSGLIIGGGFPELHAPVAAECAGLLYLARALDGHPMCGVLGVDAAMTPRLTLGYRQARAMAGSPVARAGDQVRGHEFHRTAAPAGPCPAWRLDTGEVEGHVTGSVIASYLHTHWAGHPASAARFTAAAAAAAEVAR